ncbi:MAG TPA: hypothetical protein VM328_01435 [Fimbriimonadaceae bacterium]|nr:hypothetical protein [Fimbriimonadaceae bacterium]
MRVGRRAVYFSVIGLLDAPLPLPSEVVQAVRRAKRKLAILDLSQTDMHQPKSLEWLEQLAALADAEGVRLRVVAPSGTKLRRALELLRFTRFIVVRDTVKSAVRYAV